MTNMNRSEAMVVIDFGSQYTHLIARRIRDLQVYSEIIPASAPQDAIGHLNARGIILSGGPASVYDLGAPTIPQWVIDSGLPVLGICYGMQALVHQLGGTVVAGDVREYGHADLINDPSDTGLLAGISSQVPVWMSHGDRVERLPDGMTALARTANTDCAAITDGKRWFGLQFHPEVQHTPDGMTILGNFVHRICGCSESWTPGNFVADTVDRVRAQVGDDRVICGLSGGVDSSVAAALIHRAVGPQLTCIFVNNGLLRHGEVEQVQDTFQRGLGLDLRYVDAESRFLNKLAGVTDPETKRKTIGGEFIRVFEDAAAEIDNVKWLAQGTLYPDVIESETPDNRASARIKTHHNVGGLPEHMDFGLVEPLRYLFKDEVRAVGLELGPAGRNHLPPAVPRAGLGHPHHRRGDPGAGGAAAKLRPHCAGRNQRRRPVPRHLAELRSAHRQPHGGRHGRLPHLRVCLRHPRREFRRRHDRRLGAPALRRAGPHQQPHRQ